MKVLGQIVGLHPDGKCMELSMQKVLMISESELVLMTRLVFEYNMLKMIF